MIDTTRVRSHFPALSGGTVFLDNPGGTQVAREVTDRMVRYLHGTNANHGGAFPTSHASDAVVAEARAAVADFLNAARPEEVSFGQNMTSLTFQVSRSLARELSPGDEIVVTRLDHDANVAPWLLVAADRGCTVRWVDFDPSDCTWSLDALRSAVTERTRVVAVGWASNAVGTVNDVAGASRIAREAGAISYVDAVHWAPHGPIDVQAVGCDFLACSAYKFFGPHLGILYGRHELLTRLAAYKVRPAGDAPPDKWETGTQSFEAIAGTLGALEYLSWVGETFGAGEACGAGDTSGAPDGPAGVAALPARRRSLERAMNAINAYEAGLTRLLLASLSEAPGLSIRGITDPSLVSRRVPTVSFTCEGVSPRQVAEELGRRGMNVWDGNYYALEATRRLGLEEKGGMVRVGAVHYNTADEVVRLAEAVRSIVA